MRLHRAIVLFLCVLALPAVAADRSLPYKAYIAKDDVAVRSGPGDNYYPTEKLRAGAEVEVYREESGGWLGIRPPEGSFSWVAGRYVRPGRDGVAEVMADGVVARVGSQFGEIRDVIQVRLARGESVEVLGVKHIGSGPGAQIWYRIAPPSGEFRWIANKDVVANHPNDITKPFASTTNPTAEPDRGAPTLAAANGQKLGSQPPAAFVAPPAALSIADANRPAAPPPAAAPIATHVAPPASAHIQPKTEQAPPPRAPAGPRLSRREFQAKLDELNTQVSVMLGQEPAAWNCDDLARRAEALLAEAQTSVECEGAQLLANRVVQAREIRERYAAAAPATVETLRASPQMAEIRRLREGPAGSQDSDRFDGVGRLTRVLPPKLGAPRYALVDERGNVRCYVSPAPGVNMQYYVGRKVGITGMRSQLPEKNAPLVTAKHISTLETSSLR